MRSPLCLCPKGRARSRPCLRTFVVDCTVGVEYDGPLRPRKARGLTAPLEQESPKGNKLLGSMDEFGYADTEGGDEYETPVADTVYTTRWSTDHGSGLNVSPDPSSVSFLA
ncbi:hypothetical protein Y032_0087g2098 [Ancylostoma ceylanicum]|uniref:Uncharacterized protein n=1 Tax=Ancylostoma ceylanicum TaxID=53326 RepID=A0A016TPQ0_9BILA|nr:hypothetical protein Y032_0087g2098 [Ancylostoma ceylanicum]